MNSPVKEFFALGLTGFPLERSLSPRLHAAALRDCGLQGDYRLYPIPQPPAGRIQMQALMDDLRKGRLDGLNVTIPHKQSVIPFLDELTSLARQVGAVNTIFRAGESLVGDNTDAEGFMADLQHHLPGANPRQSALVLGAGGAARAVVYALSVENWRVTVAARRLEQAHALLDSMSISTVLNSVISLDTLAEYLTAATRTRMEKHSENSTSWQAAHTLPDLIVNTTPLGMFPDSDQSPWPQGVPFPNGAFVYDLVYKPAETLLVSAARSAGRQAANGQGMLVEQAALSFERWTGMRPSIDALRQEIPGIS